ncbi:hypothetical protein [Streptosporangium sp. NPDC049376]|uniref:hypothetical protein n=1 Tax=Streptosporangium sp. NPDC049376 TaxID=3366192 RepID=UPI00379F9D82
MEILQVLDPAQGIVQFRCESGTASGRWMGKRPAKPGHFDIEIEVPEEVTEWTFASSDTTSLSEATGAGTATIIAGSVIRFDDGDDSIVEIRVGKDILLIEITNRRSELPVEGQISFCAPEIQLYPYDL